MLWNSLALLCFCYYYGLAGKSARVGYGLFMTTLHLFLGNGRWTCAMQLHTKIINYNVYQEIMLCKRFIIRV